MPKILKWILPLCLLLGALIFLGSRNQVDPEWAGLDEKLDQDFFSLHLAEDSLYALSQSIHHADVTKEEMYARLAEPFLPITEFSKFRYYVHEILKEKFVVFSSVNGSGTSTFANRLSKFVATKEENILEVAGAANFDLIYYHKYIGGEKNGKFQRGELLQFFDKCKQKPNEKFVFIFDDIDKIEPETFFGPEFWYKLYEPDSELKINGEIIDVPDNFHMISITHLKPTARIVLTNEHFRRLGKLYPMPPDESELIMYLQSRPEFKGKKLSGSKTVKDLVFSFLKINDIISTKYNSSFMFGQWTPVRTMYHEGEPDDILDYAVHHVNAFNPRKEITKNDFAPVKYAINNGGRLSGSNFFSRQFQLLEEKGFLTEFLVGLSFVLVSAVSSFFIFKRREKIISKQIRDVEKLFREFENRTRDYDIISQEINDIKSKVDDLALNKKINYEEATFFYQFFYDKSRKVEIAREAYHHFNDLVEVSLEDGILTEYEYQKLLAFLNRIKPRIGKGDYQNFQREINRIYKEHREN